MNDQKINAPEQPAYTKLPQSADAATARPGPAVGDDKGTIARYFADHGAGVMKAHQRWRNVTLIARLLTVSFGLVLVAIPLVLAWREVGGIGVGFWPVVLQRVDLFIPGMPLVVIGLVPLLWRFGWELPAGLLLLIFAGEMLLFQPDRPRLTVILSIVAITAIGYGFYLRLKRRQDPADERDLEQRVDEAMGNVLYRSVEQALKDAPFPAAYSTSPWQVLRTIPDRSRLTRGRLQAFVGSDKRLRITPLGFVGFNYNDHGLAVIEGAVDLTRERVLFTHAQELSYSEILAMHWEQETPPDDHKRELEKDAPEHVGNTPEPVGTEPAKQLSFAGLRAGLRKESHPRHTDTLTIELSGNRQIVLLFQDSDLLGKRPGRSPIESIEAIRKVWTAVSARRLHLSKPSQS